MAEEGAKSGVSLLPDGDPKGLQIKPTIDNFVRLMTNHYGDNLRLNEMTGKPEYRRNGEWREWTDTEESRMRSYFESTYSMYSQNKLSDALLIYFQNHKVNPLLEILEGLVWDGKPRVEQFLHDVMKVEDSEIGRASCRERVFLTV